MPIQLQSYDAYSLMGLPPAAEAFHAYLTTVVPNGEPVPEPTIKTFSDCTYYSYHTLGLSFCFKPTKQSDGSTVLILDSIDIYNGHTRDGFQPFTGQGYPCGLTATMEAHEIVALHGEPDRKGGGGKSRVPCWIEYQFENNGQTKGGILIQLHGIDWEDREMGWTSLVLF
ncbi:hypothetical protein CLU79DRAFT_835326 [Phycomyces nitens]|nr:hypothetical protein CLU79DRAFT_835326 [Phycomyces nitens]